MGVLVINIKDKFDYIKIIGTEYDADEMKLWSEDDFYGVYLDYQYRGMPTKVLTALVQVVMANINLQDEGLSTQKYKINRLEVFPTQLGSSYTLKGFEINVTSTTDLRYTLADYYKDFVIYTIDRQERDLYHLYMENTMWSLYQKLTIEWKDMLNFMSRFPSEKMDDIDEKSGIYFVRTGTHDIIDYVVEKISNRDAKGEVLSNKSYKANVRNFLEDVYYKGSTGLV